MAGMKPFFLTGANAKIKVNGKTLAYCTNLSYSVQIKHATPTVLGMYEPSAVEPLGYLVTGSFSVIRYIADASSTIDGPKPNGTSDKGNGIGNWGINNTSFSNLADGRAYENLNPKRLEKATTFDIEVFQKISNVTRTVTQSPITGPVFQKVTPGSSPGSSPVARTLININKTDTQVAVARIRDVRITKADFNLSKKAAATQTFNFTALYADEDSFIADFSGQGQQFA